MSVPCGLISTAGGSGVSVIFVPTGKVPGGVCIMKFFVFPVSAFITMGMIGCFDAVKSITGALITGVCAAFCRFMTGTGLFVANNVWPDGEVMAEITALSTTAFCDREGMPFITGNDSEAFIVGFITAVCTVCVCGAVGNTDFTA